jgi:hypothetical protein
MTREEMELPMINQQKILDAYMDQDKLDKASKEKFALVIQLGIIKGVSEKELQPK